MRQPRRVAPCAQRDGIPIVAEPGNSGGYSLPPDYSLPPLALTLHEALLLRLALNSLSQLSETPFKRERESLLAKIQTLRPLQQTESQHRPCFLCACGPKPASGIVKHTPLSERLPVSIALIVSWMYRQHHSLHNGNHQQPPSPTSIPPSQKFAFS